MWCQQCRHILWQDTLAILCVISETELWVFTFIVTVCVHKTILILSVYKWSVSNRLKEVNVQKKINVLIWKEDTVYGYMCMFKVYGVYIINPGTRFLASPTFNLTYRENTN